MIDFLGTILLVSVMLYGPLVFSVVFECDAKIRMCVLSFVCSYEFRKYRSISLLQSSAVVSVGFWFRFPTCRQNLTIVASASDLECLLFSGCFSTSSNTRSSPTCPQWLVVTAPWGSNLSGRSWTGRKPVYRFTFLTRALVFQTVGCW